MNINLAALIAFKKPHCEPAQTLHDHEEWSRFYLELLTDPEYQKFNIINSAFGDKDLRPWDDAELLRRARMHLAAAEIVRKLDALHDEDEED